VIDLGVMNDKPFNELMGVMNSSLIRDCPVKWAVYVAYIYIYVCD
jgi:hypothetical protein